MFERFTDRARRALALAQDEANALGHNFLGTEHLLLGLIVEADGVAGRTLRALGLDAATVRADVETILGGTPQGDAEALRAIGIDLDEVLSAATEAFGPDRVSQAMHGRGRRGILGAPAFTRRSKKVMDLSLREALSLKHNYIGTEHLLLAIVREGEGVAAQILSRRTPGLTAVRASVMHTLESYRQSGT